MNKSYDIIHLPNGLISAKAPLGFLFSYVKTDQITDAFGVTSKLLLLSNTTTKVICRNTLILF